MNIYSVSYSENRSNKIPQDSNCVWPASMTVFAENFDECYKFVKDLGEIDHIALLTKDIHLAENYPGSKK